MQTAIAKPRRMAESVFGTLKFELFFVKKDIGQTAAWKKQKDENRMTPILTEMPSRLDAHSKVRLTNSVQPAISYFFDRI